MEGQSRSRGVAVALSCVLALVFCGRAAGQGRTRPSASPSGGETLHPQGRAELTRASLLTAILEYPGPDPNDLTTEGEEHPDDEASTRLEPGTLLAPLKAASGINGTPSPAPVVGWKAMDAVGGVAADAQVAASTTHVIVTNRTTIGFYNKAGTNPCDPNKLTPCLVSALSMFKPLGLNTNAFQPEPIDTYFDVRALFDPNRHRFFIVGIGKYSKFRNVLPQQRRMVTAIAVSKSENPLDGWYLYWWDAVSHWGIDDNVFNWGDVADYPTIGMDTTLFHETHKVFNVDLAGANTFRYYRVTFHDADTMAAGLPANQVKGWVTGI